MLYDGDSSSGTMVSKTLNPDGYSIFRIKVDFPTPAAPDTKTICGFPLPASLTKLDNFSIQQIYR
jgi:hypothetical protein